MHPVDRFTLFATAVGELLAEHAGRVSDVDLDELAELIAQFVFDRERNRGEADTQKLDEWLSRFAMRLSAQHRRETEGN
jgi:hypothetical protein